MKSKIFFSLISLFQSFIVFSQGANFVRNGGFESFTAKPENPGMFHVVNQWESVTKNEQGSLLHSPDYIFNEAGYNRFINGNGLVSPKSGKGMVGVFDYEVFFQKLSSKLEENQIYYISLNFFNSIYRNDLNFFNFPGNSVIEVFLSKKKPEYALSSIQDRQFCTNGYKNLKMGNKSKKIATISLKNFSREEWHKVAYGFTVDESYDYLAFHVRFEDNNLEPSGCAHTYVLFDDIEVKSGCYHPCAGSFDKPIQGVSLLNGPNGVEESFGTINDKFRPKVSRDFPVLLSISGANYVKLIVTDRWGNLDSWEYYSISGLSNSLYDVSNMPATLLKTTLENYPDMFTLMWDGTINGNLYPNDAAYAVRLIIRGCNIGAYDESFHSVTLLPSTIPSLPLYNNNKIIKDDCCQPGSIFQDNPSERFLFFQDNIVLGDDYFLHSGQEAIHLAGNFIELQPETTVDYLSNYKAEILFCEAVENQKINFLDNHINNERNEELEVLFSLAPNPSNGKVSIISNKDEIISYRVFDKNSRECSITAEILSSHLVKLNLNHISKGMYFVEITTKNEVKHLKLVLQ
ncbi:MAG: T9SS type A sorting domain-containing protein [Schleiferiaceae bacterium]|nr:T9SS type A sorting domain-containing protein [Schleiferiaceae bacterium]